MREVITSAAHTCICCREVKVVRMAFVGCSWMVAIHKTLSSILQLGNIQFIQDKNSEQAALPDNTGNGFLD